MLAVILDPAVESFFEWNAEIEVAGLSLVNDEPAVRRGLEKVFSAFQKEFKKMHDYALLEKECGGFEHTKHFKIYPENPILHHYLRGDCRCIGKDVYADGVYPIPPPISPPEEGLGKEEELGHGRDD